MSDNEETKQPTVELQEGAVAPLIIENPYLVNIYKKLHRFQWLNLTVLVLNTVLIVSFFAVNYGNQSQIYRETVIQSQAQTEEVLGAVREETKLAVEQATEDLSKQNKKQSEATIRELQRLATAAKQPKVVKEK